MFDIIVIGGGLGGLTAGAKLAKSGKKVLLLEQHDRPGGCATTFQRKDFTLEVGLHEMDGLHSADMKSRIFKDLGIFDNVEFIKVPEFYRFVNGRYDVVVTHDPDEMTQKLVKLFPGDESGVKAYFDTIMNIRQVIKKGEINSDDTVGLFLDRIITDDDLKLILLGNLGYFHDDPYCLSLGYYCMAQNSYYSGGGNFVKGGSQVLSNALAAVIVENGGEVLLNHLAIEILHKDGKAEGVVYSKKGAESSVTAYAADIVVNASVPQLANTLINGEKAEVIRDSYEGLEPGASLLTVYFGFKTSPSRMGYEHYSTFVYHPSVIRQEDIKGNNSSDYSTRSFTFVDYSQINSGLAPAGKGVGAICCIDYVDDCDKLILVDYNKKKKLAEKLT
ncbi:MAG: NAD(P)/FAD-dependent oxidoreductase [Bacteroidales bacterium]|nr:NAD(P)/FAD-dependent oxidoreductase [Bacteroidales bacterium]